MKHFFSRNIIGILCLLSVFALIGCGEHNPNGHYAQDVRQEMDSLIKAAEDTTALLGLLDKYKAENNILGQEVTLRELGSQNCLAGRSYTAIKYLYQAYEIAIDNNDTIEISHICNQLAVNFGRMGILDQATRYHLTALHYISSYSDFKNPNNYKQYLSAINGIGKIYLLHNNYKAADSVFHKSLAGEKKLNSRRGIAINMANLGQSKQKQGQIDSALYYYKKSMDANLQDHNTLGIGLSHSNYGSLYLQQGKYDKAIEEFKLASDYLIKTTDTWYWVEPILNLAQAYIAKGEFEAAKAQLDKAQKLANNVHAMGYKARLYETFHDLYKKQGNYKEALYNYTRSIMFRDSMHFSNEKDHIRILYENMDQTRKKQELAKLASDYKLEKNKRIYTALGSAIIVLLLIILLTIMINLLKARKQRNELQKQLELTHLNFFRNVTHELRTPLTIVIGMSEDLMENEKPSMSIIQKYLARINRQGKVMLELVNQLMDFNKVTSEIGLKQNYRHGDVIAHIAGILEDCEELCHMKQIQLSLARYEPEVNMDYEPDFITKILRNLINNACKFCPEEGGIIRVTTQVENNNLLVRVKDNGIGMDEEACKHVFEPYWQSKDGSQKKSSTGIGLALANRLVLAMNGTISVESALGTGTTFSFTLPLKHKEKAKSN